MLKAGGGSDGLVVYLESKRFPDRTHAGSKTRCAPDPREWGGLNLPVFQQQGGMQEIATLEVITQEKEAEHIWVGVPEGEEGEGRGYRKKIENPSSVKELNWYRTPMIGRL